MYQQGDKMLEVRGLLVKAFATAWKNSDQSTDRDTYINSSITVIDSMQVQPEMIYAEEGQGLTDGEELDHLADLVRADGTWVYYGVPAENFFIVTWMPDAEAAEAKIAALREEGDCVACCVDLAEEWNFG
ncbi:MAG: hypothetical protein Q3X33_07665 [Gemmiger sp.]|nr:hypothetical protein [Gemmiger sp.]